MTISRTEAHKKPSKERTATTAAAAAATAKMRGKVFK